MLDINLCQLLCLQFFSFILKIVFHLVYSLLCCAKLLNLIRSHLFIFIFITVEGGSKKVLLQFMSKGVLIIFTYKSFIISGLRFRSLIYFELIFVYGVKECSNFISLYVPIWFSQQEPKNGRKYLQMMQLTTD